MQVVVDMTHEGAKDLAQTLDEDEDLTTYPRDGVIVTTEEIGKCVRRLLHDVVQPPMGVWGVCQKDITILYHSLVLSLCRDGFGDTEIITI